MRMIPPAVLTLLLAATTAAPAAAQFAKPEEALRYRKAAFTVMSVNFVRVAAMANGRQPFDPKAVADSAEVAAMMSKLPYTAFGDGTDKGDTQARPEVWTEKAKFKAAAERSQNDLAKLSQVAKGGDQATIKAAVSAAAQSCKACHVDFRRRGFGD